MHTNLYDALKKGSLFDVYTAKQEYLGKRDRFGRFLYEYANNKDVFEPIVSNYLIKQNFLNIEWPENYKFAACLTHDVDFISTNWKYTFFTAAKYALNLEINESLNRILDKKKKNISFNPYWNFKKILQLEERYGGVSSFYLKTTYRDPFGMIDNIEVLKDELGFITDIGAEVGLHGGYHSYNNPEELKREKKMLEKALGKKVIGIRMHYLRFDIPYTWRLLTDLDFKYDTTFGYSDMPGFRNGMAHPFKPYDIEADKEINILEIPLVIMDNSLFQMPIKKAWEISKKLIEATERINGVITILWHNNIFDEIYWGEWTRLYEKILQLLKKKNAWMTNGEEIYDYWIKNV